MTRRESIAALGSGALALGIQSCANPQGLGDRLAICSETFQEADFAKSCQLAYAIGYRGIEVDPSTLAGDPTALSASQRKDLRRSISESGLEYVGLHNALKSKDLHLHITTPDNALRTRSWDYFRRLVDLAADLGPDPVIVLGSGKQRNAIDGVSAGDAQKRVAEGLAKLAPHASERSVTILLEPLAPHLSNIFHTLAEVSEVVESIASPAIQTIFDTHNTAAETESIDVLVLNYRSVIRHVHVNEMDGSYPGKHDYPFAELFAALEANRYSHWVSVEVFQFEPSGPEVARLAFEYLRERAGS
jgi:sugar phosphate isomerase/epimerase